MGPATAVLRRAPSLARPPGSPAPSTTPHARPAVQPPGQVARAGAAGLVGRRDDPAGRAAATRQVGRRGGASPTATHGSPGRPVATTDATGTTVDLAAVRPGGLEQVLTHEQVHTEQIARGRAGFPVAPVADLEDEARAGGRSLMAGAAFSPELAADPGATLAFGPEDWFPDLQSQGTEEVAALARAGLTDPGGEVFTSFNQAGDGLARSMAFETSVAASGAGGGVVTTTSVALSHDPLRTAGLVGPPTIRIDVELGLGPVEEVPAYPYELTYRRLIGYTDRDGRVATVEITGTVWFSEETWVDQVGRRTPSFDALLALEGDEGYFSARLTGDGPVTSYWTELVSDERSVDQQCTSAAEAFFGGAGSRYAVLRGARFLDPRTSAGDQFTNLRNALEVVDALTLIQRAQITPGQATEPGLSDLIAEGLAALLGPVFTELVEFGTWLDELIPEPPEWFVGAMTAALEGLTWLGAEIADWWAGLDPRLRGVLKAVGWFVVGILGVAAVALLVVAAAKALGVTIAFGAAMLVVGGVLLVGTYVYSMVSRAIEAITDGSPEALLAVQTVALLDTVGISAIVEAFTNESILTGRDLGRSVEERWEGGTSGILQLVSLILMARGMRAGPRAPGGTPAEVTWRGNAGDLRTVPRERLGPLPEGHSWVRTPEGDWGVVRAPDAAAAPIEITVSGDGQGRVTHIVRSGDRVLQADVMPRAVGDTRTSGPRLPTEISDTGTRNPYRVQGEQGAMGKGHLADYADVYEGPRAHNLNRDPANFTPQARWWNEHVRNQLVQAIRQRGGGYREIPLYEGTPRYTVGNASSPPTRIPSHYVFVETTSTGVAVRAWRVPNNNALTTRTQAALPPYRLQLSEVPTGVVAADGTVARPGTWVAGVEVIGRLGRDERDSE